MSKGKNYFLDEILQTTQAAHTQNQLAREKNQEQYRQKMEGDICNLTKRVMFRWRMKVRKSAMKGRTNSYIYFLKNNYDQFLLRGTKEEGDTYFSNNGLKSVIERVKEEVKKDGFNAEVKFVSKFGLVVEISWNHHFELDNNNGKLKRVIPEATI